MVVAAKPLQEDAVGTPRRESEFGAGSSLSNHKPRTPNQEPRTPNSAPRTQNSEPNPEPEHEPRTEKRKGEASRYFVPRPAAGTGANFWMRFSCSTSPV